MPLVRIDIRRGRSPDEKQVLLDGVHAAMQEALATPAWDCDQRRCEQAREDFEAPPSESERYTVIEITTFPGRSLEAKRRLYQELACNLGVLGIDPNDVFVVLHEPHLENWGLAGQPACQRDLGVAVRVQRRRA